MKHSLNIYLAKTRSTISLSIKKSWRNALQMRTGTYQILSCRFWLTTHLTGKVRLQTFLGVTTKLSCSTSGKRSTRSPKNGEGSSRHLMPWITFVKMEPLEWYKTLKMTYSRSELFRIFPTLKMGSIEAKEVIYDWVNFTVRDKARALCELLSDPAKLQQERDFAR